MEQQKGPNVDTILGDNTVFTGKIESRGALRIDGRVEGEIVAQDTIIIGPSGVVKADIRAAVISVSGQVDGNIKSAQKVELHPTATVNGDIQTTIGSLTVEPGARINGCIIMSDDRSDGPSVSARQTPAAPSSSAPKSESSDSSTDPSGSPIQRRK